MLAIPSAARADHDMAHMSMSADDATAPSSSFAGGVSMIAASFAQMDFGGNYEGVMPSIGWMRGAWSASASLGLYRIYENGIEVYGPGDLLLSGAVTLFTSDAVRAGVSMMVSAPTGNMEQGFGMGGPMAMPAAWAAWTHRSVTLAGSGGWGGMLSGGMRDMDMAVVDPMNQSELEWSATADVAITRDVRGGVRMLGGIPVGEAGRDRVIGAMRLVWGSKRVETGAELQAGVVGDPFKVRGVVETSLHF
jgi:hypothetical protein